MARAVRWPMAMVSLSRRGVVEGVREGGGGDVVLGGDAGLGGVDAVADVGGGKGAGGVVVG